MIYGQFLCTTLAELVIQVNHHVSRPLPKRMKHADVSHRVCKRTCVGPGWQRLLRIRKGKNEHLTTITMQPKTNSNDFGGFWELISRFAFDFRRCGIFYLNDSNFGVFKVRSHAMWPYMCLCCGLFAPTQFHFECCCGCDDS